MSSFQRLNVAPNPSNAVTPGSDIFPVGAIALWTTATPPDDWLLCNGAAVSRRDYDDLFAVIGTTYGTGDASLAFTGTVTPVGANFNLVTFTVPGGTGSTWFAGKTFTVTGGPPSWSASYIFTITDPQPFNIVASATLAGVPVTFASGTDANPGVMNITIPTTFNLPNTSGRTIRGVGQAGTGPNVTLGARAGADATSFTIAAANLPPHRHGVLVPGTAQFAGSNGGGTPNLDNGTRTIAGSTWLEDGVTAVANSAISVTTTNQYIGLNFIIRT